MDVERLAEGLWRWTTSEGGCVYYEAPDAVVLFDPLLPVDEEERLLAPLDRDVVRLGLPVSILLTDARRERSTPFFRERYRADDRVPSTVDVYPVEEQVAYFIRPHRALVVPTRGLLPAADLAVERVLASELTAG